MVSRGHRRNTGRDRRYLLRLPSVYWRGREILFPRVVASTACFHHCNYPYDTFRGWKFVLYTVV